MEASNGHSINFTESSLHFTLAHNPAPINTASAMPGNYGPARIATFK